MGVDACYLHPIKLLPQRSVRILHDMYVIRCLLFLKNSQCDALFGIT